MVRPVVLSGANPQYTRQALQQRVQGMVVAKCIITTVGALENCRITRSLPHMDAPVLKALHARRYAPVTYQGRPVTVDYVFNILMVSPEFSLERPDANGRWPAPAQTPFDETKGMTPPVLIADAPVALNPSALRDVEAQGTTVKCLLTAKGTLQNCRFLNRLPQGWAQVVSALYARTYAPVTLDGQPIPVEYTFRIGPSAELASRASLSGTDRVRAR
jgi:TonB family protein